MKVLILAMTSHEADLPYHRASVQSQTGCDITYVEIAGLRSLEAHQRLYGTIQQRAREFDAFIKLDGDMVLREPTSALKMASALGSQFDHVIFPVLDYMSMAPIYGVHVFSPNCTWKLDEIAEPFVDPHPRIGKARRVVRRKGYAPAFHGYFSSAEQAFSFGLHRGFKCFVGEAGAAQLRLPNEFQLRLLWRLWRNYRKTRDPLRGLAMAGAEHVRRRRRHLTAFDYKDMSQFRPEFARLTDGGDEAIRSFCRPYWDGLAWFFVALNFPKRVIRFLAERSWRKS